MNRTRTVNGLRGWFVLAGILVVSLAAAAPARAQVYAECTDPNADMVTVWNCHMDALIVTPPATNPLHASRVAAIVSAAVFDAVNGIERRYEPIRVTPAAPPGASRQAAAIEAAYTALIWLYSSDAQKDALAREREKSLERIAASAAIANSESIELGSQWGAKVAGEIIAWRANDGFTKPIPPFFGDPTTLGRWRSATAMLGPQFAEMSPWVIDSPSQFRPAPPPGLTTGEYATDFNETISTGGVGAVVPDHPDADTVARFWTSNTPASWNRVLRQVSAKHHLTLSEKARLFALMNIAMADAAIACWDAKWVYRFWRPVTAAAFAEFDGNPATAGPTPGLPLWAPRISTPAHPEYPSGHSTQSGAAVAILIDFFGDATPFTTDSENLLATDGSRVIRSFGRFSDALEEIHNARIWGGIHFRTACSIGSAIGEAVAAHVLANALRPLHGAHVGELSTAGGR